MKPSEKISRLSDEKGIVEQSTIVRDKQLIVDEDNTYVTFKASDLQALAAELDAQHDALKVEAIREAEEKCRSMNSLICGGIPWSAKSFCYSKDLLEYANTLNSQGSE